MNLQGTQSAENPASKPSGTPLPPGFFIMPPQRATPEYLLRLKPTMNLLPIHNDAKDIFVGCRLASTAMTLFRVGRRDDACEIGQFAVDLLGKHVWVDVLKGYLETEEAPNALAWVKWCLLEVVRTMARVEERGSRRLADMIERGVGRVG